MQYHQFGEADLAGGIGLPPAGGHQVELALEFLPLAHVVRVFAGLERPQGPALAFDAGVGGNDEERGEGVHEAGFQLADGQGGAFTVVFGFGVDAAVRCFRCFGLFTLLDNHHQLCLT